MKMETTMMAYDVGLEIEKEIPYNSRTMTLNVVGHPGSQLTVYLPLEQWWAARKAFPKAAGYTMHTDNDLINDHAAADAYAEEFYQAERAKLIPDMPPEAPGTDDIVDPDAPTDKEIAEAEAHADALTH